MDTLERLRRRIAGSPTGSGPAGFAFRPSTPTSIESARSGERRLAFSLPPFLSAIYTSIANGGIGPGYGLMGLPGGFTDDCGESVVSLYEVYAQPDPNDTTWQWPVGLLPICHWGCIVYSAVYCLEEDNPVIFVDVSNKEPGHR